jgi:hypothetical protein
MGQRLGSARAFACWRSRLAIANLRIGNRCGCPTTYLDIMPKLVLTTCDPVRLAVLGVAAAAALTFLCSMIAVLLMRAP